MRFETFGVVGGGAWGTALAQTLAANGRSAVLWAREADVVAEINSRHTNTPFLPGAGLHHALRATSDLGETARQDVVLMVAPAQHVRAVCSNLAAHAPAGKVVVLCTKGLEQSSGMLMSDVVAGALPQAVTAVLSGPSFAADVAAGLPAALTIACAGEEVGARLAEAMGSRHFRLYWSDDTVGVSLGGAVKNVLAIAAGIVHGRELGASAHAAIVTRGFAELRRFGLALGARPETMAGLSGLGDLLLTCGSPQSRNMSLGREIAGGARVADVLGGRRSVAEGVFTSAAVVRLAEQRGIDMPICAAVHAIVEDRLSVDAAIEGLLTRPFKSEMT